MCNGTWQPDIIFYPFLLMWLNDTFAYLVGTQFGKHKLFPRISPKKSWEGTIGGGIMSIAAGLFLAPYIDGITVVDAGVIAGIVVVFGNFGDLIESMFKRCIEVNARPRRHARPLRLYPARPACHICLPVVQLRVVLRGHSKELFIATMIKTAEKYSGYYNYDYNNCYICREI